MRYLIIALMLSGCAGMGTKADGEAEAARRHDWEAHLQSRMGMNVSDIVAVAGPPASAFKMPNGDSIYTWSRFSAPVTNTYAMPIGYGAMATSRTTQWGCRVDYTVGADNIAKSWRWEGNACY